MSRSHGSGRHISSVAAIAATSVVFNQTARTSGLSNIVGPQIWSRFLRNRPPLPCAKVGLWPILPASNWASLACRNRRLVVADVSVKWADQAACRQVGGFQRVLPGRGCRMTLYRSCYPGWSEKPDLPGTLRAADIASRIDRRPGTARFFASLPTVKGTRKCCQTPLNAGSDGG